MDASSIYNLCKRIFSVAAACVLAACSVLPEVNAGREAARQGSKAADASSVMAVPVKGSAPGLKSSNQLPGLERSDIIFGPVSGTMEHHTGQSTWFETGLSVSDFWAHANFENPYSVEYSSWDYGIAFRGNSGKWMLLSVTSNSEWILQCGDAGSYTYPASGSLTNLDLAAGGTNSIEITAKGTGGFFFVNNEYIAALDLSCSPGPGDVSLSTGWHTDAIEGNATAFRDFTVGSVEGQSDEPSQPDDTTQSDSSASQPGCNDSDEDMICDEFEEYFISTFVPYFRIDEEEHNHLADLDHEDFRLGNGVLYLHQVSAVDCSILTDASSGEYTANYEDDTIPFGPSSEYRAPRSVLVTLLGLYPYDYLPYDTLFTGEDDTHGHYGDVETIRMCIRDDDRDEIYDLAFLHVRRHGHDHVYLPQELEGEGTHPILYTSEGKHATYISEDECENAIDSWEWVGWDEDCGDDSEDRMTIYPPTTLGYNVGEYYPGKEMTLEDYNMADQFIENARMLGAAYFSEYVWATNVSSNNRGNYFCGGLVVEDYWWYHDVISPNVYTEVNCPGAMHYKWWKPAQYRGTCWEENTDRLGSDYTSFEMTAPDPLQCMQACKDDANCVAYTYVKPNYQGSNAVCYLKNGASEPAENECCISGIRNACIEGY